MKFNLFLLLLATFAAAVAVIRSAKGEFKR